MKVISYQLDIAGLPENIRSYGELKEAVRETQREVDEADFGSEEFQEATRRLGALKESQKEYRALVRDAGREAARAAGDQQRSYFAIQAEVSNLKRAFKQLSAEERRSEVGETLKRNISAASQELKDIDAELGDYFRNVGDYEGAIGRAFERFNLGALLKGDIGEIQNLGAAIDPLSNLLGGATQQAGGLAAAAKLIGPAFALQGAIALAGAFGSAIRDAVADARDAKQILDQIGLEQGAGFEEAATELLATADLLDEPRDRVAESANALAKAYEIDFADALRLIQGAGVDGANVTGELLDVTREYPRLFAEAGINAEQFFGIVTRQVQEGIFSDKGVDAIKEALISIRELTPATREAINALGIDDAEIATTRTSDGVLGVLNLVIDRLEGIPPQSAVAGQVLADVFRGAGEDAGEGFVRTLGDILDGYDDATDASSRFRDAREAELEIARRTREAQVRIEETVGPALDRLKLEAAEFGADILESLVDLTDFASAVTDTFARAADAIEDALNRIVPGASDFRENLDDLIEQADEGLNGFLLDSLDTAFDLEGDALGRYLKAALAPEGAADAAEGRARAARQAAESILAGEPIVIPVELSGIPEIPQPERAPAPPSGTVAPFVPETQEERDALAEQADRLEKARERAAAEARRAREALTGLRAVERDLADAQVALSRAADVGTADEVDAARVRVAEVGAQAGALEVAYARVRAEVESVGPAIAEAARVAQARIDDPQDDSADALAELNEVWTTQAAIYDALRGIDEELADPDELEAVLARIERFRREEAAVPPTLPLEREAGNDLEEGVASLGTSPLDDLQERFAEVQASMRDQAEETAQATAAAAAEQFASLQDAAGPALQALGEGFATFYSDAEAGAEEFAKAILKSLVRSLDQQVYALAGKAFAFYASQGPQGIILGLGASAAIIGAWEGVKASIEYGRGGLVEPLQQAASPGVRRGQVAVYGPQRSYFAHARGGVVSGPSHAGGGVRFVGPGGQVRELEGGEPVIAKRVHQLYRPVEFQGRLMRPIDVLSEINVMSGGVPFAPSAYLEQGGVIADAVTAPPTLAQLSDGDVEYLASRVGSAVASGAASGTRGGIAEGYREASLMRYAGEPSAL